MKFHCEFKDQSAQPALAIRIRTSVKDLPRVIGESYEKIMAHLSKMGEYPTGPPFTAYFNMDMDDLDVEIGFPVGKSLPGVNDIQTTEIPAGRAGSCLYTGPYDKMKPAYDELTEWIMAHGFQSTGVAYEFYLNDPDQVSPDELQTQILFPLKEA